MNYTQFAKTLHRADLDSALFDLEVDDGTDGGITLAVRSTRFSSAHALLEQRFGRRTVSELTPSKTPMHGSPTSVTDTTFKAADDTAKFPMSVGRPLELLETPTTKEEDQQLAEDAETGSASTEDIENLSTGVIPIIESGISIERWEGASAETGSDELMVVSLRTDSSSLPEEVDFPSFVGANTEANGDSGLSSAAANAEANGDSGLSFVPMNRSQSAPVVQTGEDVTLSSVTGSKTKSKWGLRSGMYKRKQVPPVHQKGLGQGTVDGQNRLRKTVNGVLEILGTKPSIPKWLQMTPRVQHSSKKEEPAVGVSAMGTVEAQVN